MKKGIARVLIFMLAFGNLAPLFATAGNRYWTGGTSTTWGTDANWGLTSGASDGTVPTEVDSVIFDLNSAANCSLSVADTVYKITSTTGWAKGFHQKGFALTTMGSQTWDGTTGSFLTLNGKVTQTGDADFHIGTGMATLTLTGGSLYLLGSGNLDIDKAVTAYLDSVVLAMPGKTTTQTGAQARGPRRMIISGGTLTLSSNLNVEINSNVSPWSFLTGSIINGSSSLAIPVLSGQVVTFDSINMAGTTTLNIYANTASSVVTVTQTKGLVAPTLGITAFAANSKLKYNTAGKSIRVSGVLTFGTSNASAIDSIYLGASLVSCGSIASTATGVSNLFLESSSISSNGNIVFAANSNISAGTSLITFKKSATLTSAGKTLYDIAMDSAGQTLTLGDPLTCNTLNINAGGFSTSTYALKTTSDQTYNGAGAYTLAVDTISGNGNFTIGSGAGAFTLTNNRVRLMGTGNIAIGKAGLIFPKMTVAQSGNVTTNTSTVKFNVSDSFMIGTGTLTNNGDTIGLMPATCTTPLSIENGATINGSGMLSVNDTFAGTVTLPAIAMTGTGTLALRNNGTKAAVITMSGAVSAPNVVLSKESTGKLTINTGNYALSSTVGALKRSNSNATDTLHINYGSSVVTCAGYMPISVTGPIKTDFASSAWTVGGTLTMPSANATMGTSAWTVNAKSTITANGNNWPVTLTLNTPTDTVTMADSWTAQRLLIEPGTTVKLLSGGTYPITSYTAADWDGSAGAGTVKLRPTGAGTYAITNPAGMAVNYMDVVKSVPSADIDATAFTNIDGGGNGVHWLFWSAPAITVQPQSQSIVTGLPVTFSVTATGTPTLTYQWKKNTVNIGGATSATYNIAAVAAGDAASYTVVVTNGGGNVTSSAAVLTVTAGGGPSPQPLPTRTTRSKINIMFDF
ncbi:exported hypothetical protein [Gammaproteobacteria bacterium]